MKYTSCLRTRTQSIFRPLIISALLAVFSLPTRAADSLFGSVTPEIESPAVAGDALGFGGYNGGAVLSADGLTAAVAAPFGEVLGTPNSGKVYIYHFANGQWTLSGEIDDPDWASGSNNNFGYAVALSADGTEALIGSFATVNGQAQAGKAYLFALMSGSWSQTHEFDDPAQTAGDDFGATSVALSADGNTAVIGARGMTVNSNSNAGEAYIFMFANASWTQRESVPDPDDAANDQFSRAVAISGDGQSVLIGSEAAVSGQASAGKAYLYTLTNNTWSQSHEFDDPLAAMGDDFGDSGVGLSGDGQTAVIGAQTSTVNGKSMAGKVYVYGVTTGGWTKTADIGDPDNTANDEFGFPVSISEDGNSILVGSDASVGTTANAGKAYLFTLAGGTWTSAKEFDDPAASDGNADYFGRSGVSLSNDGEAAFISAYNTTVNTLANAGEAYIYQSVDDLSLTLTASPASTTPGMPVTFDATVTNNSSAVTAHAVTVTGPVLTGFGYVSDNAGGGNCSEDQYQVTCTLDSLGPGTSWDISMTFNSDNTSIPSAYNVTYAVSSNEPDPTTSNNTSMTIFSTAPASSSSGSSSSSSSSSSTTSKTSGGGGTVGFVGLLILGLTLFRKRYRV